MKPEDVVKTSDIRISVSLNKDRHPVSIEWQADDSGVEGSRAAKSCMLALWDKNEKSTMRIDLWTEDMTVEEMRIFFYETMASMADTFERATSDAPMAKELREFAKTFGQKIQIFPGS